MGQTGLPIELTFPVAWGQMDAFEHVNNVVYFRYFEDARITYFNELSMLAEMEAQAQGPILASTQCRFKIPLKFPDKVTVGACIRDLSADRFTMHYRVYSHQHDAVAASGSGLIVYYDYGENKKTDIPKHLVERIQKIEAGQAMDSFGG